MRAASFWPILETVDRKQDTKPETFDGSRTVLDEQEPGRGEDAEDKPTELWARAAPNLFASGVRPRPESARERAARLRGAAGTPDTLVERAPEGPALEADERDEEDEHPIEAAEARAGRHDTEPGYASATDSAETMPVRRVTTEELEEGPSPTAGPADPMLDTDPEGEVEPEERDTEMVSGEFSSHEALELAGHLDEEHAAREAEAARLLSDSVEVSGEEGEAARRLAEERMRGRAIDPSLTMVVGAPKHLPRLSHECRVCGRRIASPLPARFRGPTQSERGFRCDACSNVVCAAHAVRVSGFFETLFRGGRFRCVLCSPDAHPPDK